VVSGALPSGTSLSFLDEDNSLVVVLSVGERKEKSESSSDKKSEPPKKTSTADAD